MKKSCAALLRPTWTTTHPCPASPAADTPPASHGAAVSLTRQTSHHAWQACVQVTVTVLTNGPTVPSGDADSRWDGEEPKRSQPDKEGKPRPRNLLAQSREEGRGRRCWFCCLPHAARSRPWSERRAYLLRSEKARKPRAGDGTEEVSPQTGTCCARQHPARWRPAGAPETGNTSPVLEVRGGCDSGSGQPVITSPHTQEGRARDGTFLERDRLP